jgi:hypothetical protein
VSPVLLSVGAAVRGRGVIASDDRRRSSKSSRICWQYHTAPTTRATVTTTIPTTTPITIISSSEDAPEDVAAPAVDGVPREASLLAPSPFG